MNSLSSNAEDICKEFKAMRQLAKFSVIAIVISTTSGCGWLWGDKGYFRDRSNDYLTAKQAPLLTVPADLQNNTKPLDPLYPIPANVVNSTAGKDFEVPRPVPLQVVNENRSFSLQSSNGLQWFIAQQSPLQIYPQVSQYFQQAGFHIDTSRPETGEFTTAWAKPSTLTEMLSNRLLAVDNKLSQQEFRVRVRVEPGVQTNTSEIYTLVMVRPENSTAETDWPVKSQSPAIESVLLDELMANMSNYQPATTTVSLLSDTKTAAPISLVALTKNTQNLPVLSMTGDFDLVWARVERAITTSNVKIEDMDRSTGSYYINLSEKANGSNDRGFFKRLFSGDSQEERDARAERYIIKLTQVGEIIQVDVQNVRDNKPVATDKAETILKQLKDNMN